MRFMNVLFSDEATFHNNGRLASIIFITMVRKIVGNFYLFTARYAGTNVETEQIGRHFENLLRKICYYQNYL